MLVLLVLVLLPELLLHHVWLLLDVLLVSILVEFHVLAASILAESILQLLLDWDHFVIERVIASRLNAGHHLLVNSRVLLAASWCALRDSSHRGLTTPDKDLILLSLLLLLLLLNDRLNECGLVVQVDTVLALQVVHIVVQERLVVAELLPDWYQAYLVHGALGAHGLEREKKLLADIDDFTSERSPLGLRLDEGALGVLLFLLQNYIMLLEQHEFVSQLLELDIVHHGAWPTRQGACISCYATESLLLFEVGVPVEQ